MSFRTVTRATAVLGAAAALTVAGAGAAMATTHANEVDGNTVSVTFKLDQGGLADGDTCGAVLTPTAAAAGVAAKFAGGDIETIFNTLTDDEDVIVLESDATGAPFVVLGEVFGIGFNERTVSAEVPSNVYSLVSVCISDRKNPTITPTLMVGPPIDAIQGSVSTLSTGDNLTAGSGLLSDAATGNLGGGSSMPGS
ncbi:hypothetical protein M3C36_06725 [Dietzia cinnamea]|uniref:hypothetical protein n=1 Tax=Dietzia TaxID=37914 RepID=UPI0021A4BDBE|nr:hypothetical protein [Dietzia cinnamea]MCT1884881.1 hypothetical protein [Dietzia cinnamea]